MAAVIVTFSRGRARLSIPDCGRGQLAAIQAVAPSVEIEATPVDVRDLSGFESIIAQSHGLVVTISPVAMFRRELIIALAARHRLPAIYAVRAFVTDGGLISQAFSDCWTIEIYECRP